MGTELSPRFFPASCPPSCPSKLSPELSSELSPRVVPIPVPPSRDGDRAVPRARIGWRQSCPRAVPLAAPAGNSLCLGARGAGTAGRGLRGEPAGVPHPWLRLPGLAEELELVLCPGWSGRAVPRLLRGAFLSRDKGWGQRGQAQGGAAQRLGGAAGPGAAASSPPARIGRSGPASAAPCGSRSLKPRRERAEPGLARHGTKQNGIGSSTPAAASAGSREPPKPDLSLAPDPGDPQSPGRASGASAGAEPGGTKGSSGIPIPTR